MKLIHLIVKGVLEAWRLFCNETTASIQQQVLGYFPEWICTNSPRDIRIHQHTIRSQLHSVSDQICLHFVIHRSKTETGVITTSCLLSLQVYEFTKLQRCSCPTSNISQLIYKCARFHRLNNYSREAASVAFQALEFAITNLLWQPYDHKNTTLICALIFRCSWYIVR